MQYLLLLIASLCGRKCSRRFYWHTDITQFINCNCFHSQTLPPRKKIRNIRIQKNTPGRDGGGRGWARGGRGTCQSVCTQFLAQQRDIHKGPLFLTRFFALKVCAMSFYFNSRFRAYCVGSTVFPLS